MFDLKKMDGVSIGVLGDLALDIYWYADMKKSELSRETPHYPLPVVSERISLGAGGNVCANLAALQPKQLSVCGICGDDWRGKLLREKLSLIHADTDGLMEEKGRFTQAYCKPMRMGISDVIYEDPRIDFSSPLPPKEETEKALLAWLDAVDGKLDILCVCDQFQNGCVTEAIRKRLSSMKTMIAVDSRYHIGEYRGYGVLKPNEDECHAALRSAGKRPEEYDTPEKSAKELSKLTGMAVLLTLGENGSLYYHLQSDKTIRIPAVVCEGSLDICGAGDTSLSAFSCCLAAGATPKEAAEMAGCASAVTIRKIGMTGTATREEIETVWAERA